METKKSRKTLLVPALAGLSGMLLALLIGLSYYSYTQHERILMLLEERNFFLLQVASSTDLRVAEAESASSTIAALTLERDDLMSKLSKEEAKNEAFERQIRKISGTVGRLDKLSKTDEELLQKYSKVYFLNENYVPSKLKLIDTTYLAPGRKEQYFHADALPYLEDMLKAAKADGINLTIVSAYRSFETQAELKGSYLQSYGSGANTFSADQGYSEHQLGTTLDFSTPDLGGSLSGFGGTEAYAWLKENAHKYGFTLSYPEGNAYYVYEPWHWRFVGRDLASDLKRDDAHFYDWDQRKIDEYLIKIFD
ncbi:MAG: M15 family metallopeptidase [Candidatus Paceibacteria bacterium]